MTRNELATPPPRSIDEMLADAESPTPTRQPAPPKADSPARSVIALPLAQPLVRVEKPSKQTVPDPEDLKAQTILLIGSDRRWGLPGARSDTIILVRLNPANHTVGLLSVPRDLKVPIPGYGVDRINAAFEHGGEALLVKTLRDYLGVRIDHFIEVNFRGFQQVVNTLGGVLIPVDGRYYNHNDGSAAHNFADIDLQPGYQRLNATQALAYARFRHYDSDVYRAARQQLFLREVMREVFASKYQFLKLERILEVFAKATASDISSLHTIWTLTTTLHSTPTDHVTRAVVPGADSVEYGAYYYESSAPERQAALLRWYHPEWKVVVQDRTNTQLKQRPAAPAADRSLVPDGGQGLALIKPLPLGSAPRCAPTALPRGYAWGAQSPARAYTLAQHPAIAGWITAGSGHSVLLEETTWTSAPILNKPTRSLRRGGRSYDLWYESGALRQVAWRMGPTVAFLENTLRNELTSNQLLALAASCQRISG